MSKKKTLEEVVNELKNETLYIGSATSFFLIGDYWEYQMRIDELSEYFKKLFENNVKHSEREILRIVKELNRVSDNPDAEGEMFLKTLCASYISAYDARVSARERWEYFKENPDLRQRSVKTIHNRINNDGEEGVLITIEGNEVGRFWTKAEYDEVNK